MSARNSIFVEEAEVLTHQAHGGNQFVLRLRAPKTALHARPGAFVHLVCDASLPMRRPFSIMRRNRGDGWIEILYRVFGAGTGLLSQRKPGDRLSLMGPIGKPFTASPARPKALLLGGGVGIPPMIFLAELLREHKGAYSPIVMMGSEVSFPFTPRPSQIMIPGVPGGAIAAMPLMDDWGIPSRLASLQGFPGCFEGYVTELARHWLAALPAPARSEVEIFACGPHPMLAAAAALARDFGVPCQVSLEEFMACAVGGCAGCVVRTRTADGFAMKRVCVDGPVFDAASVFF